MKRLLILLLLAASSSGCVMMDDFVYYDEPAYHYSAPAQTAATCNQPIMNVSALQTAEPELLRR